MVGARMELEEGEDTEGSFGIYLGQVPSQRPGSATQSDMSMMSDLPRADTSTQIEKQGSGRT